MALFAFQFSALNSYSFPFKFGLRPHLSPTVSWLRRSGAVVSVIPRKSHAILVSLSVTLHHCENPAIFQKSIVQVVQDALKYFVPVKWINHQR